ncbi:transposase [Nonomuraea angiospora]|uniref:transposase n=1 Tax=Nonomuraea angiospora TaxID=46172 RepID=UPI0033320767
MPAALLAGERDPTVLAPLARTRMRTKILALEEAFTGRFTDHHAFLPAKTVTRVDAISADIAEVGARIDDLTAPYAAVVDRLDEIPGIGRIAAHVIIAEIGLDMSRFPTTGHLASWARLAPTIKESAGKKGSSSTGHGNRYLARVLGEAAVGASKTPTFLGERYRRIARRRGTHRCEKGATLRVTPLPTSKNLVGTTGFEPATP